MLNLDTHVLLHAVAGRLSPSETRLLRHDRWSISAIVLWEIAKLAQLGRIEVDRDERHSQRPARHARSSPAAIETDSARAVSTSDRPRTRHHCHRGEDSDAD